MTVWRDYPDIDSARLSPAARKDYRRLLADLEAARADARACRERATVAEMDRAIAADRLADATLKLADVEGRAAFLSERLAEACARLESFNTARTLVQRALYPVTQDRK